MSASKSLYRKLIAAGIPVSNHASDMYFPVTELTTTLVNESLADGTIRTRPMKFVSQCGGGLMFEAPFQFDPYWDRRARSQWVRGQDLTTQGVLKR